MAQYTLENTWLSVSVESFGAELKSLVKKDTQTEYMWKGDPQYWGRTAPVLFPFVGGLNNGCFRANRKTWPMGQHGFARDMEFELEKQTEDELWFVLKSDSTTLEKYPYEFVLKIGYRLKEHGVEVLWHVENPGQEELPFSIGGHPAFNCPIDEGRKQTDYQLLFDKNGLIFSTRLENGLASTTRDTYGLQDGYLPITESLFDKDALVIENQNIKKVSLCDENGKPYLTVEMDAPLFGIWSPVGKQAPFICIEPWYGRCDRTDFKGNIKKREWGNLLAPGEVWNAGFTVIVQEEPDEQEETAAQEEENE